MSVMISAIGVSYLLQNLVYYITGGLNQNYPTIPWISDTVKVLDKKVITVTDPATGEAVEKVLNECVTKRVTLITPVLTLVLVVALVCLIRYTKIGMAMRAASKDFETSQLMGIRINSVISTTFVIGSFLAAVGSLLFFTNYTGVTPTSGAMPGLKAFVAAVFGRNRLDSGCCGGRVYHRYLRKHHQGSWLDDLLGCVHVCPSYRNSDCEAYRTVRRKSHR